MTLKLLHASSVTSGASLNRGGSLLAAFCEPFRDGRGGGDASDAPSGRDPSSPGDSVAVLEPFLTSPFVFASPLRTGVALWLRAGRSPGWICPILAVLVSASPREGAIGRAQWARGSGVRKPPGSRVSRRYSAETRCRGCGIRAQGKRWGWEWGRQRARGSGAARRGGESRARGQGPRRCSKQEPGGTCGMHATGTA